MVGWWKKEEASCEEGSWVKVEEGGFRIFFGEEEEEEEKGHFLEDEESCIEAIFFSGETKSRRRNAAHWAWMEKRSGPVKGSVRSRSGMVVGVVCGAL